MIAGSLAVLVHPIDEPLESVYNDSRFPALDVDGTQHDLDGRPVQSGTAAGYVETTEQDIMIGRDIDGEPTGIVIDEVESRDLKATDWVADVTGTGLLAVESTGTGDIPWPLPMFWGQTGEFPEPIELNVGKIHEQWSRDDKLGDVWMTGADDGNGASIEYNDEASDNRRPTIGIGFEVVWDGRMMRGVAYESGYVAIYSVSHPAAFVRFVAEELLPYRYEGDDGHVQETLGGDE